MQQSLQDNNGRLYAGNTHGKLHNDSTDERLQDGKTDERLQGAAGPKHQVGEHKHRTKAN